MSNPFKSGHRRRCETCGLLFDCQKPAQWVGDGCQEKRKALILPVPFVRTDELRDGRWNWGGKDGVEFGRKRDQIRKWARGNDPLTPAGRNETRRCPRSG